MLVLSCGILILNAHGELLMCHASGTSRWDIPKGVGEPGETAVQTAIRETVEETGLHLDAEQLLELGRFAYRRGKDLQLYAVLSERIDTAACVCTTMFRDAHGRLRPEMDAYAWVPLAQVEERCAKSMAALLTQRLSLSSVLQQLMGPQS